MQAYCITDSGVTDASNAGSLYTSGIAVKRPECAGENCQGCGPGCYWETDGANSGEYWTGAAIDLLIPEHGELPRDDVDLIDVCIALGQTGPRATDLWERYTIAGRDARYNRQRAESIPPLTEPPRSLEPATGPIAQGVYRLPGDTYARPVKPTACHCPKFGNLVMRRRCDSGNLARTPIACGDCPQCLDWYRYQKAYQFDRLAHNIPMQTVITVSDLPDDNAAAHVRELIGRYHPQSRVGVISRNPDTYLWQTTVVFPYPFSERTSGLTAHKLDRNGYGHVNVENRCVSGQEVAAHLRASGNTDGGHQPCRFVRWCTPVDETPNTYELSDGQIETVQTGQPVVKKHEHHCAPCAIAHFAYREHLANYATGKAMPTYTEWRAMQSVKRWLDPERVHLSRDAIRGMAGALRGGADRDAKDLYIGILASGYEGPRKLIADLAAAVGDDGNINPDARRCLLWAWYALD